MEQIGKRLTAGMANPPRRATRGLPAPWRRGPVTKAWLAIGASVGNPQRMRFDALRRFALSLPHATASEQWGGVAFKVEGKVFLLITLEAGTVEGVYFKCAPDEFEALVGVDGIAQAPYFAKRHWVCVSDLLALTAPQLEARIRRSYALVVAKLPKKTQAALDAEAS